ncbi:MAG: lysophospholipase [Gemmatimonadaceae bacterium]
MKHENQEFSGGGGLRLQAQSWEPPKSPRAAIALVHGIGEHSGRYADLASHLVHHGFAVLGFDHRGHGRSPGRRGHIDTWLDYREDLRAFVRHCTQVAPGSPLFLYGHSMGALIALDYAIAHPEGLAGLIVSGVPLQPTGVAKAHLVAIARILSRIVPAFSISLGLDEKGISRDPAVIEAYRRDPLVHPLVSMRWGTEILATIDRVRSLAGTIALPLLVVHGGADPINSPDGSRELLDAASSTDKSLHLYPGGLHEPHNDLDRSLVFQDVEQWLTHRVIDD